MANTCGQCLLYQGSKTKCGGGYLGKNTTSSTAGCLSFKGPASLFSGKKCGGCRLYNSPKTKCGGGYLSKNSNSSACNSYAANPG